MSPVSRSLHQLSWTRSWSRVAVEPSKFCAQTGNRSWNTVDPCLQEAKPARFQSFSLFCLSTPCSSNSGKLAHIFCVVSKRIIVCTCILHLNWESTLLPPKVANTNFTYNILSQHFSRFSPTLLSITFVYIEGSYQTSLFNRNSMQYGNVNIHMVKRRKS